MTNETVKIVVYVPETHADQVRKAMGDAGAGSTGNYRYCSFSIKGTGRFMPVAGAQPFIGEIGKGEEVQEERIETTCNKADLPKIIAAIKAAQPYEDPVIEVYSLFASSGL